MYAGAHARSRAHQPAFVMAGDGEVVTYAELEDRSNRLAHFLRSVGLKRLDHYAILMENNSRYVECCAAGERSGLYFTCINSFLAPDEVAYIVNNSESKVLIFSEEKRAVAIEALKRCPNLELALVADGPVTARGFSTSTRRRGDCRRRRSPTSRWAPRCSTHRAQPGRRKALCGRCRSSRRCNPCRSLCSWANSGVQASERCARKIRRVLPGGGGARRRPLPRTGQGADDRLVGTDHPGVLRGDRGTGFHRLRQRTVAQPPRYRRAGRIR
jgi:hypothetical protein